MHCICVSLVSLMVLNRPCKCLIILLFNVRNLQTCIYNFRYASICRFDLNKAFWNQIGWNFEQNFCTVFTTVCLDHILCTYVWLEHKNSADFLLNNLLQSNKTLRERFCYSTKKKKRTIRNSESFKLRMEFLSLLN